MPEEVVVLALGGMVTFLGLIITVSINKHLERKHGPAAGADVLRAEVDELRAKVEEVAEMRERFLELEERLDFAERLLARDRSEDERRLEPGKT